MSAGDILIVGGTGVVGRRIAARLAPGLPGRVAIAGRDESRAAALCQELGQGSHARRMDVHDASSVERALEGIGTVMACVAQEELHLLRATIARGLAYTDIAPRLAFWRAAEEMRGDARRTGARILLGAGLTPGISNMMARRLAAELGQLDGVETAILLGLGDEYGPDSVAHIFEAVTQPYTVVENGRRREALPFSEGRVIDFSHPLGKRTAYLFPWSDAAYYPQTLGVATALGRFALEPAWAGWLAAMAVRAGARRWLRTARGSRASRRLVERLRRHAGRDDFALVVTAAGGERVLRMSLVGRSQADATADGAAELVLALASGAVREPGVWFPEQVISHERFFAALAERGWAPVVEETTPVRERAGRRARGLTVPQ
jgi:saccharopine dehydrogenase-like NADP-dependent oxidoreductase